MYSATPYPMQGTPPTPPVMTAAPPWVSSSASLYASQVPYEEFQLPSEIIPGGAILPSSQSAVNAPPPTQVGGMYQTGAMGSTGSLHPSGMYPMGAMGSMGSLHPSWRPPAPWDVSQEPFGSFNSFASSQAPQGSFNSFGQPVLMNDTFDPRKVPTFDPRKVQNMASFAPGSIAPIPQQRADRLIPLEPPREYPLKAEDQRFLGPIVHPPHALTPCPMTEVYGYSVFDEMRRKSMQLTDFGEKVRTFYGWGQAALRHTFDQTFLDRAVSQVTDDLRWYFVELKGALLNFWDKDFADELYTTGENGGLHPVQWLDLRRVHTVNTEYDETVGVQCHHKVVLCFPDGKFEFKVRDREECQAWKKRIFKVTVENEKLNAVTEALGHDAVAERARMGLRGVTMQKFFMRLQSTKGERDQLRKLIAETVRQFAKGTMPHSEIFENIFNLYTKGENMDLHRVELLYKDLLEIRRDALKSAIHEQEMQLISSHRSVFQNKERLRKIVNHAKELLAYFETQLQPENFMDEVVALRAKCDVTKDGLVNVKEFTKAGQQFIMPVEQLRAEAAILHPETSQTEAGLVSMLHGR